MTVSVGIMIIIGIIFIFVSFFVSERLTKRENDISMACFKLDEDYEFSERELNIIKRKIEDVIVNQAKDILYETNESLSSMANEKTMALGDYAVAVCDEIEKNHKEVMFLYSMLDDKQKEIMDTVKKVDDVNYEVKKLFSEMQEKQSDISESRESGKKTGIDQLTSLKQMKESILQEEKTVKSPEDTYKNKKKAKKSNNQSKKTEEKEKVISWEEKDIILTEENKSVNSDDKLDRVMEEAEENENSNDIILELYQNGESIIEIAKQLGLGVGEVKLVIDLYRGEEK